MCSILKELALFFSTPNFFATVEKVSTYFKYSKHFFCVLRMCVCVCVCRGHCQCASPLGNIFFVSFSSSASRIRYLNPGVSEKGNLFTWSQDRWNVPSRPPFPAPRRPRHLFSGCRLRSFLASPLAVTHFRTMPMGNTLIWSPRFRVHRLGLLCRGILCK